MLKGIWRLDLFISDSRLLGPSYIFAPIQQSRCAGTMPADVEQATERTKLLYHAANNQRLSVVLDEDAHSVISSHVTKAEQALGSTPIGERLPYNDYTTIDWLHDLAGWPT